MNVSLEIFAARTVGRSRERPGELRGIVANDMVVPTTVIQRDAAFSSLAPPMSSSRKDGLP
jgi:hypothetical protein